jgi:tRNA G10  N-methylase Trm11
MTKVRVKSRTKQYAALISPARDRDEPVYNWHAFKHSYSKELVRKLVKEFDLDINSWVLDPFSGGGTTLLACKELGINAKGFDILPFSVFLSNVKTRTYNPTVLQAALDKFRLEKPKKVSEGISLPDIAIVDKAFSKKVQTELLEIRQQIENIPNRKTRDFFKLGLLSILEAVSRTTKAGGFLRIVTKNVPAKSVRRLFLAKIEAMVDDVKKFNGRQSAKKVIADAQLSDSRDFLTKKKFDAIITSPPYPNRHDYTRIYGLELLLGFVKSDKEMKRIRYDTLRSHVEAKKKFAKTDYEQPDAVTKLVARIKRRGMNNSKIAEMIEGYFEDMYLSLCQMQKSLKLGGKIALVVSNVRFAGVSVPVDEILANVGKQAGLQPKAIYTARYRGNSAQQMETYSRKPTRESIVIWEN